MPELGEVESYRRRWDPARGLRVLRVRLHPRARVFLGASTVRLRRLAGETLLDSEARGKWMLFRFTGGLWLGIHLGMTGRLWVDGALPGRELSGVVRTEGGGAAGRDGGHFRVIGRHGVAAKGPAPAFAAEPVRHAPARNPRHDHLRLVTEGGTLVFSDPRGFGRVRVEEAEAPPSWWQEMPPPITSVAFTIRSMREFLRRRARSPLKAVLLDQERFPGIGNWMADEVLWRAGLHPRLLAGDLDPASALRLYRALRFVAGEAVRIIGEERRPLPHDWLYHYRWQRGGHCPRTGMPLVRETVGGRTTCWSPARQPAPESAKSPSE
jgi:formamidopyrimidine-DNA glycosylase